MFLNNKFDIMNKDECIAEFEIEQGVFSKNIVLKKDYRLPFWMKDINAWLNGRRSPKHRKHIEKLLLEIGCRDAEGYVRITHALSLNDTFWIRETGSPLTWDKVSLYSNAFDETIARIAFEGGMYGEEFSSTSPEFSTEGSFAKCWKREEKGIFLIKSGEDFANMGKEPYSEMYSSQIAKRICRDSVHYDVVKYRGRIASKCALFTDENRGFLPMYKVLGKESGSPRKVFDYFSSIGDEDSYRRMIVLDALTLNTDRHAGNYGVLFDTNTYEPISMAPVFDNNQALLPYADESDLLPQNRLKYLSGRPCRIGEDFNEIAHAMLTPQIKSDLERFKGFKFDRDTKYSLEESRLRLLEDIVNLQTDNILHGKRLYVPKYACGNMEC